MAATDTRMVTARLPVALVEQARAAALAQGTTLTVLLQLALSRYLEGGPPIDHRD